MIIIIQFFGLLVLLAGVVLVLRPNTFVALLKKYSNSPKFHVLASVARLIIGFLLVIKADASNFPLTIKAIGWVAIVAAISLAVIGRTSFKQLMHWAIHTGSSYARPVGVLAAAFGLFLILAFI